jgi:hypothetical protein
MHPREDICHLRIPATRSIVLSHSSAVAHTLISMSLTLFSPNSVGPIGPGIRSWTQWVPEYTVPVGSHWEVYTVRMLGPPEQIDLRHSFANASTEVGAPYFLLGDPTAGTMQFPRDNVNAKQGDDVDYVIRLVTPTSVVLDEARLTRTWDSTWAWRLPSAQVQGGFTQSDRDTLGLTAAAVRTVLPAAIGGGPNLIMQVIDLVRGPPRSLLQPFGSQLLSGRGVLSAQPPGALHSFGGTWSIFTIPAGYGKDDGALVEWHRRIAQFVVIREGAGDNTYVDVLEDSHWEGAFILWQFPNPTEIQYDIAPGVQLLWRWLV